MAISRRCHSFQTGAHGQGLLRGVFAAYVSHFGLLGPHDILEGKCGMAFALVPGGAHPAAIDDKLGVNIPYWSPALSGMLRAGTRIPRSTRYYYS